MTWRPVPQPECESGCTCTTTETPTPAVTRDSAPLRECGSTGCTHCREVYRFWDTDPDPVPGGGDRLHYGTKGTR